MRNNHEEIIVLFYETNNMCSIRSRIPFLSKYLASQLFYYMN